MDMMLSLAGEVGVYAVRPKMLFKKRNSPYLTFQKLMLNYRKINKILTLLGSWDGELVDCVTLSRVEAQQK